MTAVADGRPINIGRGRCVSVNRIAEIIGGRRVYLPPRPGDARHTLADWSLARDQLGWQPQVDIEEALPVVGDEIFGFRLCAELGSGAFARVFLAEQASLAGRPVVLKTSDLSGDEPQTRAQLQHTHIVPIHSVHEDTNAGLRAVCMPYFGGASLSSVLQTLWAEASRPTTGEELVRALTSIGSTPRDIIAILQALRAAGALEAELEII